MVGQGAATTSTQVAGQANLQRNLPGREFRGAEIPLAALAAALDPFKSCTEILLTPQTEANANVNLGVQDILCCELFHEAISNQFIIFGRLQIFGDRLEGHLEATKIL